MFDREQSGISMAIGGDRDRPRHAKLAGHAEAGAHASTDQSLVYAMLAVYHLLDERLPGYDAWKLSSGLDKRRKA